MTKLLTLIIYVVLTTAVIAQNIPAKEENSVRIMSYNIRNCIGIDDKWDIQRVTDVINQVAPDFVAIQEVDSATTRTNGMYMLGEVAKGHLCTLHLLLLSTFRVVNTV